MDSANHMVYKSLNQKTRIHSEINFTQWHSVVMPRLGNKNSLINSY